MTTANRPFRKILIANRGEIACRIIWTCKEMGIRTVAVHSDVDRDSLHVRFADESACIGPAPSAQSYLNIPAIISAAEIFNVDAIHPGYGFLSENVNFNRRCREAGIIFIGPYPEAMLQLGDKVEAKKVALECSIPMIEDNKATLTDYTIALSEAKRIGLPVIIKAAAGGGGRPVRGARDRQEIAECLLLEGRSDRLCKYDRFRDRA